MSVQGFNFGNGVEKYDFESLDNTPELALQDGTYPDMTAGNAKQLESSLREVDRVPYNFRSAGGSLEIGDREYDEVHGGSVVWNQLAKEINSTNWSAEANVTATFNDGIASFTSTVNGNGVKNNLGKAPISGHKYLFLLDIRATESCSAGLLLGSTHGVTAIFNVTTSFARVGAIKEAASNTSGGTVYITAITSSVNKQIDAKNVQVVDLTLLLTPTIADYIYTLETATAGSGIAKLKSWGFFTKDYYPYHVPSMESVQVSAHKMVGFNQWNEEWELGTYNSTTGEKATGSSNIRSKNLIRCFPNTIYYAKVPNSIIVFYYDADGTFIDYFGYNNATAFTTLANAHYFAFYMASAYGTTYNHDICISIHWDNSRDGEYQPYEAHTYPLDDSLTLRGIPKKDDDGNLYYDGDVYEADGTVTRRYGERAYESGDESLADAITDGTTTVYKLTTPTTETADPFQSPQIVDNWGTEEYIDAGDRDFEMPVGHRTEYPVSLKDKIESAPNLPATDGIYVLKYENGQASYVLLESVSNE